MCGNRITPCMMRWTSKEESRSFLHDSHKPDSAKNPYMNQSAYQIRQLADEIQPPESGKQTIVLLDDANTKVVLFAFAAGSGLTEHVAPFPAIIQIINGEATLTVGEESISGKPGTWIQMAPKAPHSIKAESPVVMLLTLLKLTMTQEKPKLFC